MELSLPHQCESGSRWYSRGARGPAVVNGQSWSPVMSTRLVPPLSDRDHVIGPADAPVTLVEYGDYECPYCGMAFPIVSSIIQQLGESLRFAYRHFPLTRLHPHAEHA